MKRIDSHQHFWKRELDYYDWLTEDMEPIYKDFAPNDLRPLLIKSNIDQTVLVQAAPVLKETEYLLYLAREHNFISAVVGWVDMLSDDASFQLARLAANPYFKGIRPMIQDISDDDWMLNTVLDEVFQTLIKLDLRFDALVKPRHLSRLFVLAKRYPLLQIVIDHAAKPNIAQEEFDTWAADINELAQLPNVYCKLSGLVTEAKYNPDIDSLVPYMNHVMGAFGASRVMWGSDWPVLNLVSDYAEWVSFTEAFLSRFSEQEQAQVWSETASKFYSL